MTERTFKIRCSGSTHRVLVGRRGLIFLDHERQQDVWRAQLYEDVMAVLARTRRTKVLGCGEIAVLVRARQYVAPGAGGGARDLLAYLRGKQIARALKQGRNGTCRSKR